MDSPVTLTLVISAVVFTLTNLVAYLRAKDWNGVISTLVPWAIAVGALWLAGQTRWAEGTSFDGVLLRSLSFADLVVLGLLVSGVAGTGHKLLQAIDNTRTSAVPKLVTGPAHQGSSAPPAGAVTTLSAVQVVSSLAVMVVCAAALLILFLV